MRAFNQLISQSDMVTYVFYIFRLAASQPATLTTLNTNPSRLCVASLGL